MDLIGYALVIAACLAGSAFFSSSETALFRLRSHDLEEELEKSKGPGAVAVRDLLGSTSRLLVTILLGNNVVNILGASVAAALAIRLLGPELGIPVSTFFMTVAVLVFCEVIPKAVAARHPRRIAFSIGLPLYLLHQLLRPVHFLFDRIVEPLVRRITGGAEGEEALSPEDVLRLARQAVSDGMETSTPLAIIGATSAAADMTVEEIMVPRTEITAYSLDEPAAQLLEDLLEERFTRALIYKGSIDDIQGLVHLKDLVSLVRAGGTSVEGILKPVLRVPARKLILPLLTDMQRSLCHMAVVKDEFGVTQGLLTQEDILEEIVGEIRDEFDTEELLTIRRLPEGGFEALGSVTVLDFNRESGWSIEAERGDTLGGLVFNTLGHAPRRSERVRVGRYEFTVVDVSGSRIARVRVHEIDEGREDADG
ncbi:MAG: hemolysin family protein [Myxococcota bacterium]|nr:HlyC/CorC family transporter [Myxococcales bacterium]